MEWEWVSRLACSPFMLQRALHVYLDTEHALRIRSRRQIC